MLEELRCIIQDALDDLCSPKASFDVSARALERLERQMADSCFLDQGGSRESWDHFLALQYTFECNIPSRLIAWMSASTVKLEQVMSQGVPDGERALASQLSRALSIIQGIALSHDPSKVFLGRKCSLEVLLELLLASRHLTLPMVSVDGERSSSAHDKHLTILPLTSTILDTLLCILVDSPQALRAFENIHGVQAVVKILKRAGTPREVRMKCLEFLYFYLLDETSPTEAVSSQRFASPLSTTSAAVPSLTMPSLQKPGTRLPKPSLNTTPLRPLSRHGSGSSSETSSSSRSTSGSSTHSFTSVSSTSTTPASSIPPSPAKSLTQTSQGQTNPKMLFQTPSSTLKFPVPQAVPRHDMMMMLRKDVDYEPLSPKKTGFGMGAGERERVSTPNSRSRPRAQTHGHSYTPSRTYTPSSSSQLSVRGGSELYDGGGSWKRKTTEEKKQLLGTMLGNVDALVEGVRKAGIWGLG